MAKLVKEYPHGCSDKQISKAIEDYANEITASGGDINTVLRLTPLMVVGHAELQSRQTKRITQVSVGLGILSIVIAGVALLVSILGNRSNTDSQNQQLELLKTIQRDVQKQNTSDMQKQQLETLKAIHSELQNDNRKK
jgi:hypothetical protein